MEQRSRQRLARIAVSSATLALILLVACSDSSDRSAPPPGATPGATPTPGTTDPIGELPIDETAPLAGLPGPTDVVTDDHGVKHIYGPDAHSVLFVQGYVTAQQRFFMMDVLRRFATGRLSGLFGTLTLATDAENRTVFMTRDGRRLEEALWERVQQEDPEAAGFAQAYTDGVNAWLADLRAGRNGAKLPPEYSFPIIGLGAEQLEPWRPQDCLALGRLQAWNLSITPFAEIARARLADALPDDIERDVFRFAPATRATILPLADEPPARAAAASDAPAIAPGQVPRERLDAILAAHERARRWSPIGFGEHVGSNNWVISPRLTESGHAIMANDPHLQLFNPPIWHMVQLVAEGDGPGSPTAMSLNGVIFPGLPGIILGHNEHGAWGATTSTWDTTDAYVEQVTTPPDYPASPRTVLFQGRQVPVLRVEEQIPVNRGEPRTIVIEIVPRHGPMVPDPDLNDDVEGLAATGMSFRWTGHEVTLDSRFLIDLGRACNVEEFKQAIRSLAAGGQNWVWADVSGDIAYFPYVLIPQRPPGTRPWLPLPGTGEAEWLSDESGRPLWVPEHQVPQAVNPPEGYLASSNNDTIGTTLDDDPANDPLYLGWSYDLGFRQERILELFSNAAGLRDPDAKITLDDVVRCQYDHHSKEAARLLPFLFAAAEARPDLVTPEMAEALGRLRAWGEAKPGTEPGAVAYDLVAGVDPAEVRDDVPPRETEVSDEEKADAAASSIFVAWLSRLVRATFADDLAGTGVGVPGGQDATKALLHLLEDVGREEDAFRVHTAGPDGESTLWDDRTTPQKESRDEILLAALDAGLAFLRETLESDVQSEWLWGRLHRARFQHFFGQGGLPIFDLFPFPAPGGRFTVNPAAFSLTTDDYTFAGGPSMRHVVVLDPAGIRAVNVLPGGNNGDPGGRDNENYNRIAPEIDYGKHIPKWIRGEVFELRITRGEVAEHAVRRVRFSPG